MLKDKLIKLGNNGRLLVVADLHGKYDYYQEFLELWNPKNDYIVFLGDMIHSVSSNDGSIEILDDVIEKTQKYPNFITLLGNHELAHIINQSVFKNDINQKREFELLIAKKKKFLEPYLSDYVKFFKSMPFFVTTSNGLFLSHSGPSKDYENISKIDNYFSDVLYDFLWNRYGDYDEVTVNNFLDYMGLKCMVVGHTNVFGYKCYSNQMILASSYSSRAKAYLDIDLSKKIDSMNDLKEYIQYL